jgi:hypothetical protein
MAAGEKKYRFSGDPLSRRDADPGYQVGWRHKAQFQKGHLDGEARRKAAELQVQDTEGKVYYPELIMVLEP